MAPKSHGVKSHGYVRVQCKECDDRILHIAPESPVHLFSECYTVIHTRVAANIRRCSNTAIMALNAIILHRIAPHERIESTRPQFFDSLS